MDQDTILGYLILVLIITVILVILYYQLKLIVKQASLENEGYWEPSSDPEELEPFPDRRNAEELEECRMRREWGILHPIYACPHCHKKGFVRTKPVRREGLLGSARTSGLVFAGGWPLLGIGVTMKEETTQAHCMNCNFTWDV